MKELSIEEKAKAYDIALNKIKMLLGTGSSCSREELEYVFPELNEESEGERIRKHLIKHFGNKSKTAWNGMPVDKIIAWLEKLGEQKTANWLQELEDKLANATPQQLAEWKEKYFKEESAEWSEVDEEIARKGVLILKSCATGFPTDEKFANEFESWLKSIKDRVQPQPKQEWSEEDIDMIDWLIRCCEKEHEELCNDKYGHQDIVSDLKRDCRKKWDWLESLKNKAVPQSQWKPSKEHLHTLEAVISDYTEQGLSYTKDSLNELYEQLKKL